MSSARPASRRRRAPGRGGFTIAEVLISVAVTSIVFMALISFSGTVATIYRATTDYGLALQTARAALDRIGHAVQMADRAELTQIEAYDEDIPGSENRFALDLTRDATVHRYTYDPAQRRIFLEVGSGRTTVLAERVTSSTFACNAVPRPDGTVSASYVRTYVKVEIGEATVELVRTHPVEVVREELVAE